MSAEAWSVPAFAAIAELCTDRVGLTVLSHRVQSMENVIGRAMRRSGTKQPERYLELLATDDEQLGCLIDDLVVGETYFFREPRQWAFVRRRVIGDFLTRHGPGAGFRAWSAGCATGEEAYTLAMVLDEEGMGACSQITASDISRRSLAKAARGRYRTWSLRGLEPDVIKRYFTRRGDEFQVPSRLRDKVAFQHLNLALDAYPSHTTATAGLHLILCRNVFIYFDEATIARVARRLHDALHDGGWLVTASSDPPMNDYAPFSVVVDDAGVFYRRLAAHDAPKVDPGPAPPGITLTVSRPLQRSMPVSIGDRSEVRKPGTSRPAKRKDERRRASAQTRQARQSAPVGDTGKQVDDAAQALAEVKTLVDTQGAEVAAAAAATFVDTLPGCTELRYLRALLLAEAGKLTDAVAEMGNVVYLEPGLAAGHFSLGALNMRLGKRGAAGNCFRRARRLAADMGADDLVPLAEGERAGRFLEAAEAQLSLLNDLDGAA
ncbi:MAG: hypothetical protein DRQ37_02500 [Gammaproteobacteria bacterium]|nr:MAG: hypothetical protein DRQ37_02500 [Gammaproteobacteria bacterium]